MTRCLLLGFAAALFAACGGEPDVKQQIVTAIHVMEKAAESGERRVACGVVFDLYIVNTAIDFNDDTGGMAVEVSDEAVDDLLPAEVKAGELARSQVRPQKAFRGRHFPAQFPRASSAKRANRWDANFCRRSRRA